jgi:uncharacterized protein YbcI
MPRAAIVETGRAALKTSRAPGGDNSRTPGSGSSSGKDRVVPPGGIVRTYRVSQQLGAATAIPEKSEAQLDRGAISSQISREIVRLHARLYGRGPTKAKTYIHDDYVLCLLEDVFTPAERTLVGAGKSEQVHATRIAFQDAVRAEFVTLVEEVVGRRVRAFVSQVHIDPEISAELFVLEPVEVDESGTGA